MRSALLRRLVVGCFVLISLVVASFWVRSYWVIDWFTWSSTSRDHVLASAGGRLIYADCDWPNRRVAVRFRHVRTARTEPAWFEKTRHTDGFRLIGFEYASAVLPYETGRIYLSFYMPPWRLIGVPYGAVFAITLVPEAGLLLGWVRRRGRRRRGLCVRCGYDLRASGARCSECGWEV
jgi:hypothetical protein